MDKLDIATLRFLSVPPERLARIREVVRLAREGIAKRANLPSQVFLDRGGLVRNSMEEVTKLLELPPLPVATEKESGTDRPFEYVTPPRMPPIVVVHPDVIDAVRDPSERAELLSRLVFQAPLVHLAAHHAGKLNWKKAEEFFSWAAERTGI